MREKIRASRLIQELESHAFGEKDMSSTQITASLGLLKKIIPDLKAVDATVEHSGDLQINLLSFLDVSAEQLDS